MSQRKFEVLLNNDRNWLSKYGGFISLVLIVLLVVGILKIQIPVYQNVEVYADNQEMAWIQIESANDRFEEGTLVEIETIGDTEMNLKVVSVSDESKDTKNVWFQTTDGNALQSKENLRVIVEKKSLLESLVGTFIN